MTNQQTIIPAKNLHGSNMDSLREQYINAMSKVRDAVETMREDIDFHSRDYADSNHFEQARKQRREMIVKLMDVYIYLEDIASSI